MLPLTLYCNCPCTYYENIEKKNMPRTFLDLNLLANMVAKLGNIVGEHVIFDMFANNAGQFGHTLMDTRQCVKI